jgi:DNA polymerase I
MSMDTPPKLFLIDTFGLLFQVFHAIPEMTGPGGLPTNALFGFARDLLYLRKELHPDYLICVFDPPGPTFRDRIYPEYKAHRTPAPESLLTQIPLAYKLLEAMRIPALTVADFEADDVLATVAQAGEARGMDVFICSSDKDCRQLLDDRIRIYSLRKREIFDRESLRKDWGIEPKQVVDFQMLVGDSVDNVPGVAGIGEKTAAKLLQEFGTVDNLLANVEKVPGPKKQENLRKAMSELPRVRQLVTLRSDVPVTLQWEQWSLADWDAERLLALFREWGFRSFAQEVRAASPAESSGTGPPAQLQTVEATPVSDLFAEVTDEPAAMAGAPVPLPAADEQRAGEAPPGPPWDYSRYHLVNTPEQFAAFQESLRAQTRFAIDLETTGLDPRRAELVGLAFAWQPGEAYYLAVRGPVGEPVLDVKKVLDELRPLLEAAKPAKVNQNIKYDQMVLRQQGVRLGGVVGDSMVAHYLLFAGEREHNMEYLSRTFLHHDVIPITALIGKKGKNQLRMDQVPTQRVAEYSGEDADVAIQLCAQLEADVAREGLKELYDNLEVPLIEVLAELEFNGIRIDAPRLRELGEEMAGQLQILEKEIHDLAGRPFNIASLNQLRQVLFTDLKLTPRRKTGITKQPSTDQETLEELALEHPLPKKLLEHRKIAKLKSTYVDALPAMMNPDTGRVHAAFNQAVAATGRLSSSDPNLQNIPIRTADGSRIRQAFVPEPGWVLLAADYSQIELRLLAHFCGDPELRRAFAEDRDVHAAVAAQVFGVLEADVTSTMRGLAKTVNFGVIYGMSAFGLARRLEIPKEEAARFIDGYFARYPQVLAYQDQLLTKARTTGFVSTILGRRRRFDPQAIRPNSTYQQRNQAEREAINMEIQGSAADLIKVAMLNLYRRLQREQHQARLLLQIHDELVLEVPPGELQEVGRIVHDEMKAALADRIDVPLKVDVAAGPNWLDVQEVA